MTVGEAPGMTPDIALEFIKEGDKQDLNMMFHFQHMEADCIGNACVHTGFKLKKLKKVMSTWQDKMYGVAWNANYMENHDQPRSVSRFGDERDITTCRRKCLQTRISSCRARRLCIRDRKSA